MFVVERGWVRQRIVEAGQRGAFEAEIRNGLAEGEIVVLHPSSSTRAIGCATACE